MPYTTRRRLPFVAVSFDHDFCNHYCPRCAAKLITPSSPLCAFPDGAPDCILSHPKYDGPDITRPDHCVRQDTAEAFYDTRTDSPVHCSGCDALLDELLTPDGITYVSEILSSPLKGRRAPYGWRALLTDSMELYR